MIAIYPVSGVKVSSAFTGTGHNFFRPHGRFVRCQNHQQYRGKDGAAGDQGSQGYRLAAEGPSKEQSHNGNDEGISKHAGRGAVVVDIDIGRKTERGAEGKK